MDDVTVDSSAGRVGWAKIAVSAFVGIAVTALGTVVATRFLSREPDLVYSVVESVPFTAPDKVLGIYQATIANEGQREVDEVLAVIRVPTSAVDRFKVIAPGSLRYDAKADGDVLRISMPMMNPGDSLSVSILATGVLFPLPSRPDVSVRARGLNGKEKVDKPKGGDFMTVLLTVTGAVSGLGGSLSAATIFRNRLRKMAERMP